MNIKDRFIAISKFLTEHEILHEVEVLKRYPKQIPTVYLDWAQEIKHLSLDELAKFETECDSSIVESKSFKSFLDTVNELRDIPFLNSTETKIPNNLSRKLNVKKKHEIQTLKTVVDNIDDVDTIIDIGGGAGHLSSVLLHESSRDAYCIDINEQFQKQGVGKLKRWSPETLERLKFVNVKIEKDYDFPFQYTKEKTLMVGLHSCGPLSTYLVEHYHQNNLGKMLNFGCCYEKLTDEYNLSKLANTNPLKLKNNALHLAARSFAVITGDELLKRIKVKKYRYGLHYFVSDRFGIEFYSVGNGHKDDYNNSFSLYAKKYHKGDELDTISEEELDLFYSQKSTQEKILNNILADIIRGTLGRLIEIYIILDRAIYLQEYNHDVSVFQYFNRGLSPRNLGIFASN